MISGGIGDYMLKQINGTISELIAQQFFVKNNYIVSKPINDFNEYDLIIDREDCGIIKVQIKTIYWDNSKKRWLCSLVTSHRRSGRIYNKKYNDNSYDYLFGVNKENNKGYLIPKSHIKNSRSITFYPLDEKEEFINYRVDL